MTLYYFRRGSMEDHIEVIHNKSFVEGLSLENNLIYIISKFLLINLSNYFVIEKKHTEFHDSNQLKSKLTNFRN